MYDFDSILDNVENKTVLNHLSKQKKWLLIIKMSQYPYRGQTAM